MSRKAIELGCAALVCLGICGTSFGKYGGGSGTSKDPYLISTAEQLNAIGANSSDWAKCFKLMADIDLSAYKGTKFNRIGTHFVLNPFIGVLDGNSHTISNFTYDSKYTDMAGLVGCLGKGGLVKNLGLVGVHVTGGRFVGGLVGFSLYGTVIKCYSSGSVTGNKDVGGLVARVWLETIVYSFWDVQTSGQSKSLGGEGKTTAQMQDINTYLIAGWDFLGETANGAANIWFMPAGNYPRFVWEKDGL